MIRWIIQSILSEGPGLAVFGEESDRITVHPTKVNDDGCTEQMLQLSMHCTAMFL
ncbi:MAG: hypothetical protein OQL09_04080 [Gammaproteobacteria bacterium]|nr:hypothetical protein [Gammaproteobacteria bacterium]